MRADTWWWLFGMLGTAYFAVAIYGGSDRAAFGVALCAYFAGVYGERVRRAFVLAERAQGVES